VAHWARLLLAELASGSKMTSIAVNLNNLKAA